MGQRAPKRTADSCSASLPGLEVAAPTADEIDSLIGASLAMEALRELIRKVAPAPYLVLLEGDKGVGKELVARAIHGSSRREGRWVTIDCGTCQSSLFASELFGHVEGGFTDAARPRNGAILEAQGGTLFLDEMAKLTLDLQAKLMRALAKNGTFKQVGSDKNLAVGCRFIVATNASLEQLVAEGKFLGDLFDRLCVLRIRVPALRERTEDIRDLLVAMGAVLGMAVILDARAEALLRGWSWPGNVRELENGLQRLHAFHAPPPGEPLVIGPELVHAGWPEVKSRDRFVPVRALHDMLRSLYKQGPVPGLSKAIARIAPAVALEVGGTRSAAAQLMVVKETYFAKLLKRRGPE